MTRLVTIMIDWCGPIFSANMSGRGLRDGKVAKLMDSVLGVVVPLPVVCF